MDIAPSSLLVKPPGMVRVSNAAAGSFSARSSSPRQELSIMPLPASCWPRETCSETLRGSSNRISTTFDTTRLTDGCQIQTSPCFQGRCDCPHISGMEDQSPTPPLSRPGSSVLTIQDQELPSSPDHSPPSSTVNGNAFKGDESHHFAVDLQQALNNVGSYSQHVEGDLRHQYIDIRDIHASYYDSPRPQYVQYPPYQQFPSYVSYPSHPFGPPTPVPVSTPESLAMSQYPHTYAWPAQEESHASFNGRRDKTYCPMSPEADGDEVLCDKPYARLIYEALMQAPGHRMMLREIYDWFQRHTSKPAESGTNGWQNSIRHNLSMNQAFENDKSDPANASGQKQKINSVWVLTENAIRNGVQSTTRYRKTGSGKRINSNRVPAPSRQRSGAKGGKAARRAAQLRKKEHPLHQGQPPSTPLHYTQTPIYDYEGSMYDGADSSDTFSVRDPATPLPDFLFGREADYRAHRYATPMTITSPGCGSSDAACIGHPDYSLADYGYQSTSDLTLEEILKVHQDSIASNLST